MGCLTRILINIIAIGLTVWIMPGLEIKNGFWGLLLVASIFGLVNALIRPVVKLLTLPLTILTLGLFTLVINTAMLGLTSWLSGGLLYFSGNSTQNFITFFLAAIIISLVSMVLDGILKGGKKK